MKRTKSAVFALCATAAVAAFLVASIKRVPPGNEALRISRGGQPQILGSGWHFVRPLSGAFAVYPVGEVSVRFPQDGTAAVLLGDGRETAAALSFRLKIPRGSAQSLHEILGRNFSAGFDRIVRDAVEIRAASWETGAGGEAPEAFARAVASDLAESLSGARVEILAARVESWGDAAGEAPAAEANVPAAPLRKIVFIGVDAGDWGIINPLIREGRLPNFKKIVEGGATGPLRSMDPMISPLLWTTMATGKLPEAHGILSCTAVDPATGAQIPITRMYRKVDAFWNMMSDYGRSVAVIGWLATYPAETIHGTMVTDRVGYLAYAATLGQGDAPLPGAVSPPERAEEINGLIVRSRDVSFDEMKRFMHVDKAELERSRTDRFDAHNLVNDMILIYATASSYRAIALHLLEKDRPDFLGVYFELVDAAGHLFMPFAPPRRESVSEEDYRKYKDAMTETYVFQDRIIGELLERCDDNTVVMITSDHGFKSLDARPTADAGITGGHALQWHNPEGIVCLYGPGIRRGGRIEGASIIDVTPTILALAGFPRVEDMPGRVLGEAFEPSLASSVNPASVATLQRRRAPESAPVPRGGALEDAEMRKLEALGYITVENPDALNNLGQRYQNQGEFEKAIAEFKKALALRPNHAGTLNNLGVSYGRLKRYPEAEEAFLRALEVKPKDMFAMNNLAVLYMESGRLDQARRYAEQAAATEPKYANGRYSLGVIYAHAGEFDRATKEFEAALAIEPDNARFRAALEQCRRDAGARR
jgi:predicted AlkP superfamily phosphohydrolase/phosphomutase